METDDDSRDTSRPRRQSGRERGRDREAEEDTQREVEVDIIGRSGTGDPESPKPVDIGDIGDGGRDRRDAPKDYQNGKNGSRNQSVETSDKSGHGRDNDRRSPGKHSGDSERPKRSYDTDTRDSSPERKRLATDRPFHGIDVVFRLLLPCKKMGIIIGKQGAHIQVIREKTGARIKIAPSAPGLEERIITISARVETLEGWTSAEEALLCLYRRSVANMEEERPSGDDSDSADDSDKDDQPRQASSVLRMLIAGSQTGALIGKGGYKIKQFREDSGAPIRILEEIPRGANVGDRVVQVSGKVEHVQAALKLICGHLKEHPARELDYMARKTSYPSTGGPIPIVTAGVGTHGWPYSKYGSDDRDLSRGRDSRDYRDGRENRLPLRDVRDYSRSDPRGYRDSGRSSSLKRDREDRPRESHRDPYRDRERERERDREREREWERENERTRSREKEYPFSLSSREYAPKVVPVLPLIAGGSPSGGRHVRAEVQLANADMGALIGKKGGTIGHIRTISGASVKVHESRGSSSYRIVEIAGSPDQVSIAESMVEKCTGRQGNHH